MASPDRLLPEPKPQSPPDAALSVLLVVVFMNLLGFGIVIPLLPFYGRSFHAPPWQIGLIFSAYAMGGFVGEPFWGRLSANNNTKRAP